MPRVVEFCVDSVWRVPKDTSFWIVASMRAGSTRARSVASSSDGACGSLVFPIGFGGQLDAGHAKIGAAAATLLLLLLSRSDRRRRMLAGFVEMKGMAAANAAWAMTNLDHMVSREGNLLAILI